LSGQRVGNAQFQSPYELVPANHDNTEKQLLNYPGAIRRFCPPDKPPSRICRRRQYVFNHPNVAPFISKLLIQQLVTSNPTPAYVRRVADVFSDDAGGGVDRGNLARVIRAILLDPEARGNNKTDPDYGHLKEPVIFTTNFLRALDARGQVRTNLSDGVINSVTSNLDQDVFNPPSVFNYYPMDYSIPNTNLAAPEFAIMTTGTALKRPNLINQFVFNANGVGLTANNFALATTTGTSISWARYQPLAVSDPTGALLVETLNRELLNGSMSADVRTQMMNAAQAVASTNPLKRTQTALYLLLTSSQYQVQR
jgi:hypothetical protein